MPNQEIIELTIDETNQLRQKLGLTPLRNTSNNNGRNNIINNDVRHNDDGNLTTTIPTDKNNHNNHDEQILEMSIEETNVLREKLGLKPLYNNSGQQGSSSSTKKMELHVPAENDAEKKAAYERIENAKLRREVELGIQTKFAGNALTDSIDNAESWAKKMLFNDDNNKESSSNQCIQKKSYSSKQKQKGNVSRNDEYDESALHGLNVMHSIHEIEEGTTTILTLADTSLLKTKDDTSKKILGLNDDNDDIADLENVNLTEQKRRQDGLREKRKLEMGMGRAGGYAGYDDDEFEELGGTQAPSEFKSILLNDAKDKKKKRRGFTIGSTTTLDDDEQESDLFASMEAGKAISLISATNVSRDKVASDFMTIEEDRMLREQQKQQKKDSEKFRKRKKKEKKKKKKKDGKHLRDDDNSDDDNDDNEQEENDRQYATSAKGLLVDLEATAVGLTNQVVKRKRSHHSHDNDDDNYSTAPHSTTKVGSDIEQQQPTKRTKFDEAMAKANERSILTKTKVELRQQPQPDYDDDEPDDAFLNEALAKARRMSRLKEISGGRSSSKKGADVVIDAVQSLKKEHASNEDEDQGKGKFVFSIDETLEFTRALQAKTESVPTVSENTNANNTHPTAATTIEKTIIKKEPVDESAMDISKTDVNSQMQEDDDEDMNMEELAKKVQMDDDDDNEHNDDVALDGTTGTAVPLGRGVGNMLHLLIQSGEMTRKNAGKEEMRGRAKDKKTYEDYEPLDLSKVVRIDEKNAKGKDLEFAKREIKLDYRDEHGRLLTRKEAFRQLSYQFHGYGSGKRKEEKKLKQLQQEQAQIRLASRQTEDTVAAGTFGALKATQKATGKAFVVHKTS